VEARRKRKQLKKRSHEVASFHLERSATDLLLSEKSISLPASLSRVNFQIDVYGLPIVKLADGLGVALAPIVLGVHLIVDV